MLSNYKGTRNSKTAKCYPLPDVAQVVIDPDTQRRYFRGRLLGKGGFARCYEVTDMKTNQAYACKVVSKARIAKPHQRKKIVNEIEIHRSLNYSYVVGFHGFFEDDKNVYILLELCSRKSLVQLLKQRKSLLEPEVRYFMRQAIKACSYLHSLNIIHRDIKLGNFFINNDMQLKLGDFGLACRVGSSTSDEMTVCGTPNYIAPEVLKKGRHGYEVDTWALGCVMYTLLVGRPPFETMSLKETYTRIKTNQYVIPSRISKSAAKLIQKFLSNNPQNRPCLHTVCETDEFFVKGFVPSSLPSSCCMVPPRFTALHRSSSNSEQNGTTQSTSNKINYVFTKLQLKDENTNDRTKWIEKETKSSSTSPTQDPTIHLVSPDDLYHKLSACLTCMPKASDSSPSGDTSTNSTSDGNSSDTLKKLYVCKWVDYSNKYGFGAELSDGSVLVRFNDGTKMTLTRDRQFVRYYDKEKQISSFHPESAPDKLGRKVILLEYFATYMEKHLLKGARQESTLSTLDRESAPFLSIWVRTQKAMILYLSNGILQVNFFGDHTKIILNPSARDELVTFINENREHSDYVLSNIVQYGCPQNVATRLEYCKMMLRKLNGFASDESSI
ncbi:serine/threonine-protein kinase PLK1-like [Dendronephthya gigantea]|uniref:serine/threonine-protein kinase PLK1-like n=1 Tax=Dendronephthya gigantea TaxID=151771 RepID=UPI001069AF27|nr:serine/threonine-protein kinase PLK1-like [Dendronephthya gigantea]XP_028403701.1 serine/threonine-protein kinase PLK1-like [Dendronephthya gigantea]